MVVGKTARTKQWVSGQQIDSFSDLGAGSSGDEDDESLENGVDGDADGAEDDTGINPAQDWDAFEELARRSTSTSKTSVRTEFLKGSLVKAITKEVLTPQQLSSILRILMHTYPRYIDRPSREAVQTCLAKIFDYDFRTQEGRLSAATLKWLDNEVNQKICGPGSYHSGSTILNLLCWTVTLFQSYLKAQGLETLKASPSWSTLVKSLAVSCHALQASRVKKTVKQSGTIYLRSCIRKNTAAIPILIDDLVAAKDLTPKTTSAALLGVVIACSIRLKPHFGTGPEEGLAWVRERKDNVLHYYRENILAARTATEPHILMAFNDFVGTCLDQADLEPGTELAKAMEKALLRSADLALPVLDVFFTAYTSPVQLQGRDKEQRTIPPVLLQDRLLPQLLAASKSTNSLTRSSAALLLNTLIMPCSGRADSAGLLKSLATEIGSPLRNNKTASPEQRIALCQMLESVRSAAQSETAVLGEVSECICGSLVKETNEVALKASLQTLGDTLKLQLLQDIDCTKSSGALLVKGMSDSKANIRRQYLGAVGDVLWTLAQRSEGDTPAMQSFAQATLPGFDTALKTATAGAAGSAAEGWIAVASIRGPAARWLSSKLSPASQTVLSTLLSAGAKPSFLLAEKSYRKLSNSDDEIWLVRALESVLLDIETTPKLVADHSLRIAITQPLLQIAIESQHHAHRSQARQAVKNVQLKHTSGALAPVFVDGLDVWLQGAEKQDVLKATTEEVIMPDRPARLRAFLSCVAAVGRNAPQSLGDVLVISHHPLLASRGTPLWVDLVLKTGQDPQKLASEYAESLLEHIWKGTSHTSASMRAAAYNSISTLAFIAPTAFLQPLTLRVTSLLDTQRYSFVGDTEMGIYAQPEGQAFVDVLAANNKASGQTAKGKNAALDKWDQETRSALAAKKKAAPAPALSKADKALVEGQLKKEAEIRQRVQTVVADVRQALCCIESLTFSKAEGLSGLVPELLTALLAAIRAPQAELFQEQAFQTFLRLYETCAARISDVRLSLALAVLRGEAPESVPADFKTEELALIVTRVLYRLRFQSEQQPFDSSTFSLSAPLLSRCVASEGLGIAKGDNDAAMEQLALVVDVIAFHVRQFADPAFPRLVMIRSLITALQRYPSLARASTDALVELGSAIADNTTQSELDALLDGLLVDEAPVRHACLQALTPLDLTELDYSNQLWVAVQDVDERNEKLANSIWEDNGLDVKDDSLETLLPFLDHPSGFVRASAASAIAETVGQLPSLAGRAIDLLSLTYAEAAKERLPEYDRFGMLVEASLDQTDPWQHRVAIAEALQHMAASLGSVEIASLFQLLIAGKALGDRSEAVQSKMLDAGIAVVDISGTENLQPLMDLFQEYLGSKKGSQSADDRITESVIVLLGRLARHLEAADARMGSVIDRLLVALTTPSELVQVAVADCLPPLVRADKEKGARVIEQLLRETLNAAKYAERRGAAYGLAGAVKGRGLSALKEFDIITRLTDATEDKKNNNARQGAMFAFETLSSTLGRLFEPYIIKIIPLLLTCLGDTSTDVREATSDAARVIMSKISGHAVKLILPSLLSGLDDRQWRTKKGAIELMGAMAYLAPKQLSQSLPTILPPLTEVLTDTHKQVSTAANTSLKKFGEVVSNPEIQAMQNVLLGALVDPTKKTSKALDVLLTTSFVHYIDTSSLALIIPIIDRGLRDRGTELKRKGAQIVGNLASLTDSKDLISYLPQLIPRVREVLIDPVPEARATAAKSLGVLIERLGEDAFPTMVDDLMMTLKSDLSGVDQQGAAQGLSEVLAGLGIDRMENMLPEIIQYTSSSRAYVREGFISLLVYLPSVFGDRFSPYLGRIIQPILSGLADDSEYVREASMRAGRMIVTNHSTKAIDLLLPELEQGLFDQSWRIRLSSVQLVGELLFRLSGISGKAEMDEDEGKEEEDTTYHSNSEAARKLLEVLGRERRDKVLAALYILRQDSAGQVRMFTIGVWKALVANTPKTVRDMLPALMHLVIRLLAAPGEEQRETTARTLGELCRKQGDRILGDIIPILQQASQGSVSAKQGCCLAFAEMLESTTKSQLEGHEDAIIESVRGALVDESPVVRQAAAQAFDALQTQIGPRSIDQTIPTLLRALTGQGGASDAALSALKELMSVRAQAIFPILIPTLIASPISAFNAQALGSLVTVAGSALNRRLAQILDALQRDRETQADDAIRDELDTAIKAVLSSVEDHDGLHMLMLHLLGLARDPRMQKRIGGCELFATFCQVTNEDFSSYHVDWIRQLLSLYEENNEGVLVSAHAALEALGKTLSKDQMEALSVPLRRTIESMCSPGHEVPGFCRAGGLKPILPILIQGLLAGTNEQREQSAFGLGDVVERTAVDALKPYVTQITGPLIRIIAERYPAPVKAAILSTLTVLLTRVPAFVRPFFPQLQRTFVKNLSEPASSTIRSRAATGLGVLMGLQPRIDPLITELVNGCGHEEQEIRDSMANALAAVLLSGGKNVGPAAEVQVAELIRATMEEPSKEGFNNSISRCLAALLLHEKGHAEPLARNLWETPATPMTSSAILLCLEIAPEQLYKIDPSRMVSRILKNVINEHTGIARSAREARDLLKKTAPWSENEDVQSRVA